MFAQGLTPILNVSDIRASFAWFEKLGWTKGWEGVIRLRSAASVPVNARSSCVGTRREAVAAGSASHTFGPDGDEIGDKGAWMSVWVDDVDAVHQHCLERGIEVTWPPADMPWRVREMHVRHPDGHVFRIGRGLDE